MSERVKMLAQSPHTLAQQPKDRAVLLAFSGGADSAALLHSLCEWRRIDGFSLTVAHVNHGIRGEEAIRDRDFCVALAKQYGVEICVLDADVPSLARERGRGIEETAREVRYAYFACLMRERNIPILVTAHHADDNLETVLFRLSRGTGLRGLCGIAPTRPFADGMLVRPLLGVPKREILDYCEENGIPFVTDSTNADTAYARNRIRAEMLPVIEALFPGASVRVAHMTEELRQDAAYLDALAKELLQAAACADGIDRKKLADAPSPLRRRALAQFAENRCGVGIEAVHVDALDALCVGQTPRAEVALPRDTVALCANGRLSIRKKKACAPDTTPFRLPLTLGLCDAGVTGIRVFSEKCGNEIKVHNLSTAPYIILKGEFDIIKESLFWRYREDGDLLLMGGMHRKLRRLQAERGIDARLRDRIPLLCDAEGIVWAPLVGVRDGVTLGKASDFDAVAIGLIFPD